MKRGFHWFNAAEWTFLLFLVLIVLGVAANGVHESALLDAVTKTFLGSLDFLAAFLGGAALLVAVFSETGGLAFLVLILLGLILFKERIGELLVAAFFLLLLIAIIF